MKLEIEFERLIRKKRGYDHFNKRHCILKARGIERKLRESNFDLIFVPNSPDYIAYLDTKIPILYIRDTTFQLFINYYPSFCGLREKQVREGNEIEKRALKNAWKVVYSSKWGAASAIDFYRTDKRKISIIGFGANLLFEPQRKLVQGLRAEEECNLLFVGVEWERKGGDIAYKTLLKLRAEGFKCNLFVVGCKPPIAQKSDGIVIVPFLNKKYHEEYYALFHFYSIAHFLVLPTKADCTPVVFSEAAAFGVPVLTSNTGGVPDVIHEGVNGFLFPPGSDETQYSEKIKSVFNDRHSYNNLRRSCRNEYETRLTWKSWSENIEMLLSGRKIANFKQTIS